MRAIILSAFFLVLAFAGGALIALAQTGFLAPGLAQTRSGVSVGGWHGDWAAGSPAAGAGHRAWIAKNGLLAMSNKEAVYLVTDEDTDGAKLDAACTYEVSGGGQDAYWWSVTLYDASGFLPRNDGGALSIDASQVGSVEGAWTATISQARPPEGFWLSSEKAGDFNLLLRLYRPSEALLANPERVVNPPKLTKVGCS